MAGSMQFLQIHEFRTKNTLSNTLSSTKRANPPCGAFPKDCNAISP